MAHTHTYEIQTSILTIEGEVTFGNGTPPAMTTELPINMSIKDYNRVGHFLEQCMAITRDLGEITKIKIEKKIL